MNDNFPVDGSLSALLVLGVSSCGTLSSAIINMLKYYIWNLFIQEQLNIIHDLPHLFHSDDYFGTNNLCPNCFSSIKYYFGTNKDYFVTNKDYFVTNKDYFVTNKDYFGTNKDCFGTNKEEFKTKNVCPTW